MSGITWHWLERLHDLGVILKLRTRIPTHLRHPLKRSVLFRSSYHDLANMIAIIVTAILIRVLELPYAIVAHVLRVVIAILNLAMSTSVDAELLQAHSAPLATIMIWDFVQVKISHGFQDMLFLLDLLICLRFRWFSVMFRMTLDEA